MSEYESVRDDLDTELFDVIGKSVTFIKRSSTIYNTRGEIENDTQTSSTVTIVPFNINEKTLNHQSFGNLPEGAMMAAVRYDLDVAINDSFTIEGDTWDVHGIEKNYLDQNVITIVALVKKQP
jgi:hypothetical protein